MPAAWSPRSRLPAASPNASRAVYVPSSEGKKRMNKVVSIDGEIVADEQAKVSVLDHGLLYGDGLFEGIRVRAGRVFRMQQHMMRLQLGARVLGLALPFDAERMARVVTDAVRAFGRK